MFLCWNKVKTKKKLIQIINQENFNKDDLNFNLSLHNNFFKIQIGKSEGKHQLKKLGVTKDLKGGLT
jgi:hypothetical protein